MARLQGASLLLALTAASVLTSAQQLASNQPDSMMLKDGEKLIGAVEHADASALTFKSSALGELTITWDKIQEVHSARRFAVIPKTVKLQRKGDEGKVPVGEITVQDQKVQLSGTTPSGVPQTVPVSDVSGIVDQAAFENAFRASSFTQGWKGGATGGISLTEATQKNESFTGAINLTRTTPDVSWLDIRSRTLIDFNSAYSQLTQPATPMVKTSLIHFDAEQDWYLNPRLFAFGSGAIDHSYSQGLRLQQTYGGGVGFVAIKRASQELDLKVSADYIEQRFEVGTSDNLIGSQFGETYTRKFVHGILLNEQGSFTPSWNDTNAYSSILTAGLTFPVYHRLGFTIGALDDFINNPPPAFKKNSFQLTIGATYAFK